MFENEGTEIESTQSDVTPEPSSEVQPDAQPEQQAAAPQQQKEVPFHEHPRWKEVMEERNAERQARAKLEEQLQQMQRQIQQSQRPKPEVKKDPMIERLLGIDPEFANDYQSIKEQAALAKQLKEELSNMREQQFVERAVGKFEELNKANNVPADLAPYIRAQLDEQYRQGKIRNLGDLEQAYKSVHAPLEKFIADREKSALAKYTAEKKSAAAKPAAQPKGRAAAPGQAKGPTSPQDAKSARLAEALTLYRASKADSGLG